MRLMFIALLVMISYEISSSKGIVNLLAWWDNENYSLIQDEVKLKCDVDIAFQGYTETRQFLSLINEVDWDIMIFKSNIPDFLVEKFNKKDIHLYSKLLPKYPEFIAKSFLEKTKGKLSNFTYFSMNMIVFLYNPEVITIKKDDTIKTIIEKVKSTQKNFILLEDANVIHAILNENGSNQFSFINFFKLFDYENLIVNDYIHDYKNLGVSITRSSLVFKNITEAEKQGVHLEYMILPKYDYVMYNYIVQLHENPNTNCVIDLLTSKDFMLKYSEKTFNFNPYSEFKNIKNKIFYQEYESFYNLGVANELKSLYLTKEQDKQANDLWNEILVSLGM